MLTEQQHRSKPLAASKDIKELAGSDKAAQAFLFLALGYLFLGLTFGLIGGFQYILPDFLKQKLSFEKSRPLHVYLVISWIFTAAQGGIYYYLPRIAKRKLYWQDGAWLQFGLQLVTSLSIVTCFFMGYFSGREYLEFPAPMGLLIALTWLPFAINFFGTLKPDYKKAPVYYFSWTAGIVFFYLTLGESYLWLFDHFNFNQVRDTTVQWKALGAMVGSWNMLIYGTSMYIMDKMKGDNKVSYSRVAFFFFFLGLTNLLFNWGHHTYIEPAKPWVKTVAYVISMTELVILGQIIYKFRKTISAARKNFHILPYRFLSYADLWIFINLTLAIAISVPAINFFTHGTHITVAHAMGATIGINTMLLFASVFYILSQTKAAAVERNKKWITVGSAITNIALIVFWSSLVGSGLVKISGKLNNDHFSTIMKHSEGLFKAFAFSGVFIMIGLLLVITAAFKVIIQKQQVEIEVELKETKEVA
jgi:nitric oxide reductase subunit B